jgi:hypothetical protein
MADRPEIFKAVAKYVVINPYRRFLNPASILRKSGCITTLVAFVSDPHDNDAGYGSLIVADHVFSLFY